MPLLRPDQPARAPGGIDHAVVAALAAAAAFGALLADGAATGWSPADVAYRAGLAVLAVLAGAKARRWAWLWVTAVATAAAPDLLTAAPAAAGLVLALVNVTLGRRTRIVGALVGGLAVQTLLRLELAEPNGLASLVAAVALVPLFASALRRASTPVRRTAFVLGGVALVVALGAVVAQGVAVLDARSSVAEGIDAARLGFDQARSGQERRARESFDRAAAAFGEANDALTQPWVLPARAVPLLGQHAVAMDEITQAGADLAGTAAASAADAPIDQLQFVNGVLDLDQVAAFADPLDRAAAALREADGVVDDVDSPWLLPPLADRVDQFADEVDEALPQAELARRGVEVAPGLFGRGGLRRYFIAFVTPAEQRGIDGFMGNYGILTAEDGDVELAQSHEITVLTDRLEDAQAAYTTPEDYKTRYGRFRVESYPGDAGLTPDLPSMAEVIEQLWTDADGPPLDGVILVDPYALQALLTFTGPISVTGYDTPLTSENAADFLLRDQYVTFGDRAGRKDFLEEASRLTFEALTSGDLPGPREASDVLGPMVDQGRLLVHSFHDEERTFFADAGLDGAFPERQGHDLLALTTQNTSHNKGDTFLHRSLDYEITVDPATGEATAVATVTLRNDAPAGGLPDVFIGNNNRIEGALPFPALPPGTNRMFLSLYTPLFVDSLQRGQTELPVEPGQELGVNVWSRYVAVPAQSTVTLTFRLSGVIDPGDAYRLAYAGQPTANTDDVTVTVHREGRDEPVASAHWADGEDHTLGADLG